MTTHICRDFLSMHPTSSSPYARYYNLYLVSIFLRGCLNYQVVGHTNFNLDGSTITKGSGVNNANINVGLGKERAVQLPGSYVVSAADIDRIIALKSNSNGLLNSGLFRVSGIDTATNSLYMVARSWLEPPPVETNVSWRLFEKESVATATFANGNNGLANPNYRSNGTASTSRIILQSPHATAWQVRICAEAPIDSDGGIGTSTATCPCSFSPGFGGNGAGDFDIGGRHLHPALFFNLSDINTSQKTVGWHGGLSNRGSGLPPRYYMWGDDQTGSCVIIVRQHGDSAMNQLVGFGLPEDEELPLPLDPIHRLFVFGGTAIGGDIMEMEAGPRQGDAMMGVAMGLGNQPITCVPGTWCYLNGGGINTTIMHDAIASDSIYLGASELYGYDLYAGTWDYADFNGQAPAIQMEPRRLGRFPFARRGRENFNNFSTSVDAGRTWLHMQTGIFLPWSGSIVP